MLRMSSLKEFEVGIYAQVVEGVMEGGLSHR